MPGLGTFTSCRRAAVVDGDSIQAPANEIAFDACLGAKDSVLYASVARAMDIDLDQAQDIVTAEVDAINHALVAHGEYVIPRVGTLSSKTGFTEFVPFVDKALPTLRLKPLDRQEEDSAERSFRELAEQERRNAFVRSLQRTASSAAAIAVFALIAFVFAQLPERGSVKPQMASIGYEHPVKAISQQSASALASVQPSSPLVLVFNTPNDGSCEVLPEEKISPDLVGEYCLVVASLFDMTEAQRFMDMGNDKYYVLEKDGRCRVYVATADSQQELYAKAKAEGLYDKYPQAWICRR